MDYKSTENLVILSTNSPSVPSTSVPSKNDICQNRSAAHNDIDALCCRPGVVHNDSEQRHSDIACIETSEGHAPDNNSSSRNHCPYSATDTPSYQLQNHTSYNYTATKRTSYNDSAVNHSPSYYDPAHKHTSSYNDSTHSCNFSSCKESTPSPDTLPHSRSGKYCNSSPAFRDPNKNLENTSQCGCALNQNYSHDCADALSSVSSGDVRGCVCVSRRPPRIYKNYNSKASLFSGLTQLVIGVLCIAFNGVVMAFGGLATYECCGIWGGITFVVTGAAGILAAKSRRYQIIAFLFLCETSIVVTLTLFSYGIVGAYFAIPTFNTKRCSEYFSKRYSTENLCQIAAALSCLLTILAVMEAAAASWGLVIGGKAIRDRNKACNRGDLQTCRPIHSSLKVNALKRYTVPRYERLQSTLSANTATPAFRTYYKGTDESTSTESRTTRRKDISAPEITVDCNSILNPPIAIETVSESIPQNNHDYVLGNLY